MFSFFSRIHDDSIWFVATPVFYEGTSGRIRRRSSTPPAISLCNVEMGEVTFTVFFIGGSVGSRSLNGEIRRFRQRTFPEPSHAFRPRYPGDASIYSSMIFPRKTRELLDEVRNVLWFISNPRRVVLNIFKNSRTQGIRRGQLVALDADETKVCLCTGAAADELWRDVLYDKLAPSRT